MKDFLVIAYTTQGDYYEKLSENLVSSCKSNNIPYKLTKISNLGSWEKNTHYKAEFIKNELIANPEHNLVYVDVDAIFHSYPDFFTNLDTDVSFRIENFKWRSNEPLSGTIFLRNKPELIPFIEDWMRINNEIPAKRMDPLTWEQYHMKEALDLHTNLSFTNLPAEYVCITDHTRKLYPGIVPVVEHFQASRKTAR